MPEVIAVPVRQSGSLRLEDAAREPAEARQALWQAVLLRLQEDPAISRASYAGWLRGTRLLGHDGDTFLVAAQHSFARDRLERSFRGPIERAIAHCTGRPAPRASFIVGMGDGARRVPADPQLVAAEGAEGSGARRPDSHALVVAAPVAATAHASGSGPPPPAPASPRAASRNGSRAAHPFSPGFARRGPGSGPGGVVPLGGLAARVAIVRSRAAVLRAALADPVLELIARRVEGGVAQLEAALAQVVAAAHRSSGPLALADVEATLHAPRAPTSHALSQPEEVLQAVARCSGVPVAELAGKRRDRDVVLPRQVAMYLMREETGASLSDIGALLGGRNHSTVLHGCEKIAQALPHDELVRRLVEAARRSLSDRRGLSGGRALDSGHSRPV